MNSGPQNTLPFISGTSEDKPNTGSEICSEMDKVYFRINRSNPGDEYWSVGGGWVVNSSTWTIAVGTSPWSWPDLGWQDGRAYTLNSRGLDLAGNLSQWTTASFRWTRRRPA